MCSSELVHVCASPENPESSSSSRRRNLITPVQLQAAAAIALSTGVCPHSIHDDNVSSNDTLPHDSRNCPIPNLDPDDFASTLPPESGKAGWKTEHKLLVDATVSPEPSNDQHSCLREIDKNSCQATLTDLSFSRCLLVLVRLLEECKHRSNLKECKVYSAPNANLLCRMSSTLPPLPIPTTFSFPLLSLYITSQYFLIFYMCPC